MLIWIVDMDSIWPYTATVPTFNSCLGILHDRTPDCHQTFQGMDDLTNERSFDSQANGSLICIAYFWTCHPWMFVQPGTGRNPVD